MTPRIMPNRIYPMGERIPTICQTIKGAWSRATSFSRLADSLVAVVIVGMALALVVAIAGWPR
jgi:hypothetical protein